MVLWTGCFGNWVRFLTNFKIDPSTWTDCRLYYFLAFFGSHYSSMLLSLMSVEKCFAVYFPLKAKTVCTVRTAKWAAGVAAIVLASYDSVYFCGSGIIYWIVRSLYLFPQSWLFCNSERYRLCSVFIWTIHNNAY